MTQIGLGHIQCLSDALAARQTRHGAIYVDSDGSSIAVYVVAAWEIPVM